MLFLLAATLLLGVGNARPAIGGEGGGSHYMPGMSGDFALALIGPSGFYLRSDLAYFQGDIGSVTLGDRIYSSASQDVWLDSLKFVYLAGHGAGRIREVPSTTPVRAVRPTAQMNGRRSSTR